MKRTTSFRFFVLCFCFLLPIFCLLTTSCCLYAEDKIVAIVNNEAITSRDLNDFLNFMRLQLSREYKGMELEDKIVSLKSDLLNKLIEDRLILQEANKEKVSLDENRIKSRISEIKKHYNSDIEFQEELMRQGLTQADIEKKIREQFLMFNIIEREVRSKITIKPDEVTNFYENNRKEMLSSEKRELEAFALEKEDLAEAFSYSLRSGKKLEDLATRYPFTVNKLKVSSEDELNKDIEEVVFKLGINEISNPVKINDKYYVFRLIDIISPQQLTLKEAQNRIQNFLFEKRIQEKLNQWIDELKEKSYIKIN